MPRLLPILATLLLATLRTIAEENSGPITSPDRRFVFRFLTEEEAKASDNDRFVVEEKKTQRVVLHAPEEAEGFPQSARVLFSPDSSHLALNFRVGGRYDTTMIYRWNGRQFVQTAKPEGALGGQLEASKAAQLKALGMPKNTYLRRIWDTWETRRWIDANTAVVFGSSTRTYVDKEEGIADLSAEFLFTIRFDKQGKIKLLKREEPPSEEAKTSR